ncbi:nucleotidyltransferase family protein [Phaeobacter gallaeciensis]|uniref:Nucleotidyltransferase family protein n=1 Tax=Phaeobacter gallaeciensis TaxID=60890 RepID=A0A366WZV1_9RHOB|nr:MULTISPECIES: nucleotidyltransferase family protein [Roseobacteraceae]MBT8168075.1 nucleotidyltransferase family protein [Falsiruegeria litorea]RBW56120.1 nucleotidyltransferase family protein [Phaeobacter gallaeciensis]
MPEVTAIILAAGLSRRMGALNKLLLPVGDVPLIRKMVDVYSTAVGSVLVVTGHQASEVETVLAGSSVKTVFNTEYRNGQPTSVACGLRAASNADAVLIGLGDQPLLSADDIHALLVTHFSADRSRISIPMNGDQRGNPIVVPDNLFARLLADPKSPGCREFTRTHPEHVQFHPLASAGYYTDLDTPEAYAALKAGTLEKTTCKPFGNSQHVCAKNSL